MMEEVWVFFGVFVCVVGFFFIVFVFMVFWFGYIFCFVLVLVLVLVGLCRVGWGSYCSVVEKRGRVG